MFLDPTFMAFIAVPALIVIAALIFIANQYKRCPSNKIIVVYGKTGGTSTAKCVHGGYYLLKARLSSRYLLS